MTVEYGSPAYIAFILFTLAIPTALFFIFRKRSDRVKKYLILGIMLLNIAQHFLKSVLYPHLGLEGFTIFSTAYNVCAFLIIASPLAMIFRFKFLRDFFFYVGTIAGMIAIAVPYWSIGKPFWDADYIRSFICHSLLFTSSVLPLMFGFHKTSYKSFYKVGLCFVAAIGLILLNDALCIYLGIYPGVSAEDGVFNALATINPLWTFGPPDNFAWVRGIVKFFVPDSWVGVSGTDCIPVLWYAFPLYLGVTLIAFLICLFTQLYVRAKARMREKQDKK